VALDAVQLRSYASQVLAIAANHHPGFRLSQPGAVDAENAPTALSSVVDFKNGQKT